MKTKLVMIAFAIIYGTLVFSQEDSADRKNFLIGINMGFSSNKVKIENQKDEKTTSFNITPVFGIIVGKRFTCGISLDYSFVDNTDDEDYNDDKKSWTVLLFARFDGRFAEKIKWYIEPGIGRKEFLKDSEGYIDNELLVKTDFGILYAFSNRLGLELKVAGIGYDHVTFKSFYDLDAQTIFFGAIKPNVGLHYYF